jgi:DNA-directed RNA polymerase subunit M/transcription elongation factor TFIIS
MASSKCIQKLNLILNDINKAEKIEKSIYNYAHEQCILKNIEPIIENKYFLRIYVNKLMSIYNNINEKSYIKNTNLLNKINNDEIDLNIIAFLSPQEIHEEHWRKYIDKQSAVDEFLYSRTIGVKTKEYKCGRCKERNCSYYQLQVRCSDEPMTTFINCLNCGNNWSYN